MNQKQLSRTECAEIAKPMARSRLAELGLTQAVLDNLVLGFGLDGDLWTFELYEPMDRPEEAIVHVAVEVNRQTGEARFVNKERDKA